MHLELGCDGPRLIEAVQDGALQVVHGCRSPTASPLQPEGNTIRSGHSASCSRNPQCSEHAAAVPSTEDVNQLRPSWDTLAQCGTAPKAERREGCAVAAATSVKKAHRVLGCAPPYQGAHSRPCRRASSAAGADQPGRGPSRRTHPERLRHRRRLHALSPVQPASPSAELAARCCGGDTN